MNEIKKTNIDKRMKERKYRKLVSEIPVVLPSYSQLIVFGANNMQ